MSDRTDHKLGDVAIARFQYRHEAEFAAGFLDDAEIPYRLQIDDPLMGMTFSSSATLWVRGMDVRRAREVLDLPEPVRAVTAAPPPRRPPGATGPARLGDGVPVRGDEERALRRDRGAELTPLERTLALAFCIAGLGVAGFVLSSPAAALVAVISAPFGLGALAGRTIGPVRKVLRAISGSAP